jgi:uncharacterized hydrophobic protein (TIGR00271 family)
MLVRNPSEATAYWLQLVVAMGIATFGLVLNSTAVVIGAMLIAPLMTPIVGLAMGLAVGSPFLFLRATGRVLMSLAVVIGGAALITRLLPFNELTSEIAARTTPTALDLFTAAFCAVAGAYASMRPGSGTTATAAGTSIGISLVPPLCASGYGVGTAQWNVASGAALLFTANFVAIIVVCTTVFVAAGFNRVNVAHLEGRELARADGERVARALASRLSRLFASPGGPGMRWALPFALLMAVYFPLSHALDQVVWQIQVRAAANAILAPLAEQIVQTKLRVEHGEVELKLLVVGSTDQAERLRSELELELARIAGVKPLLEVTAVPDARALMGLAARLRDATPPPATVTVPPPPEPAALLLRAHDQLRERVRSLWPTQHAGAVDAVSFYPSDTRKLVVAVTHVGNPVDDMTRESLSLALSKSLGQEVELIDLHIPMEVALLEAEPTGFRDLDRALERARLVPTLAVCVEVPPAPAGPSSRTKERYEALSQRLHSVIDAIPNATDWASGQGWRVRFMRGTCKESPLAAP